MHTGKSGKLNQGNQRPGFIEKLKVWKFRSLGGEVSVRNPRDGRYGGVIRGGESRGSPSQEVGAQARAPAQGVLGRHTWTKLLSKMEKSRSWSNSPLRRWRWSRPGRPVGQAGTRARSRGSKFGGLFQEAGPGIPPHPSPPVGLGTAPR